MRYKSRKVLYVDVDGTMFRNGELNKHLLTTIKAMKADDYFVALWSAQGLDYAKRFAATYDITYLFDAILPKPNFVADDKGWSWTRYTKFVSLFPIHPGFDIENPGG
jgi:hypothetical protein